MRWRDYLFSTVYTMYILLLFLSAFFLLTLACLPSFQTKVAIFFASSSSLFFVLGTLILIAAALLSCGLSYVDKQEILKINLKSEIAPNVISSWVIHTLEKMFSLKNWCVETIIRKDQLLEIVVYDSFKRGELLYRNQEKLKSQICSLLLEFAGYSGDIIFTVIER
ncbi:hypothetical protein [Rhabdochlamydiaceae symbiont of Dictyostelium giganteum]|uniref:hypothetical protein n=1 Tax=Rhabdochlamydiaceae symbiont of Dictyostelium giganteum TaxID=3342349 RepID=UPI00385162CF